MLSRRVAYGLALAAAALLQICLDDYLSWFVLALVVCFPLLALLLSLPAMRGCALSLSPVALSVARGTRAAWVVQVENKSRLPLTRLTFTLQTTNRLTGAQQVQRRSLSGASDGVRLREEIESPHCGACVCSILRPRVYDLLGLCSLRLKGPPPATVLVLPRPTAETPPPGFLPGAEGAGRKPRPGGGPGEDYDLRPYRPGDPLHSVHWKLSSKLDDLVVRETLEAQNSARILTFDHFGPLATLDVVLDRVCGLSRALLAGAQPHRIEWVEAVSGYRRSREVRSEGDLTAFLAATLAEPGPPTGKSVLDAPPSAAREGGTVRRFHVTAPEGGTQ